MSDNVRVDAAEFMALYEALKAAEKDRDTWERHWREAAEDCESCANNNWEEKATALLAENRLLHDALEAQAKRCLDLWQLGSCEECDDSAKCRVNDVLSAAPLTVAEVERVRRLEAVAQAAQALLDARGAHIEGCVPLKNALAALEDV